MWQRFAKMVARICKQPETIALKKKILGTENV